jgi:branched-chain amino acid transport system substrate-binding protein
MTVQMQQVTDSGAGLVQITGDPAFCIAAIQGLSAVGYEGEISAVSQCITDATREALAESGDLEGVHVTSTMPVGASDDPTFQLYEAVVDAYGSEVSDPVSSIAMGGFVALSALVASLEGISGDDITSETVIETIKAMPETDLPGGGGVTFQCGGSAAPQLPAVCTNQLLRATLDAGGVPSTFEVVDASEFIAP